MQHKFIGIDISKQTFDAAFVQQGKWKYLNTNNSSKGFKVLEKHLDPSDVIVMEASGPYYLKLANYFYSKEY